MAYLFSQFLSIVIGETKRKKNVLCKKNRGFSAEEPNSLKQLGQGPLKLRN